MWLHRIVDWFKADHHVVYTATVLVGVVWYFVDPTYNMLHVLYSAMWSNMWAPSIWTLLGILIADIRNDRRHKATKIHHVDTIEGLAGQIEDLSDRLAALIRGGTTDDNTVE